MRRRISGAIVAAVAVAVVAFGVPLAVAVRSLYREDATIGLEREAARAGIQVPADFRTSGDPVELSHGRDDTRLAVYDVTGRRLLGDGPTDGGAPVATAAGGHAANTTHDGDLVVALPLTSNEQVFAVMRAARPIDDVNARTYRAWGLMAALAAVVVLAAWRVARLQARRLARPVEDLTTAVGRLGAGDFTTRAAPTDVPELAAAGTALDTTAERLGDLVARERSFSADAAHQLRTPLTGLRLVVERAGLTEALDQVDRLEATIDDLLALARDTPTDRGPTDLVPLVDEVAAPWHGRLAAADRPLHVEVAGAAEDLRTSSSAAAIRQVLDVLVDNAATHGAGAVTVSVRPSGGGIALDVTDEGAGFSDPGRAFARRAGTSPGSPGHGIGLALARSLAEAEGARLLLVTAAPRPRLRLLLPPTPDPPISVIPADTR